MTCLLSCLVIVGIIANGLLRVDGFSLIPTRYHRQQVLFSQSTTFISRSCRFTLNSLHGLPPCYRNTLIRHLSRSDASANNNDGASTTTSTQDMQTIAATSQETNIPPGRVRDRDTWVRWSSESVVRAGLFRQPASQEDNTSTDEDTTNSDAPSSSLTLMEYLGIADSTDYDAVHSHTRYAVLSHGTQDDPIYCYFNRAALATFEWPESQVYQLPSRYSAPSGAVRQQRQAMLQQVTAATITTTMPESTTTTAVTDTHNDTSDATKSNQDSTTKFQEGLVLNDSVRCNARGELLGIDTIYYWNVYNDQGIRVGQTAVFDCESIRPVSNEDLQGTTVPTKE
jgi:hypothetical protein